MLVSLLLPLLALGFFLTLEKASGWYFDRYIVPAHKAERAAQQAAGARP